MVLYLAGRYKRVLFYLFFPLIVGLIVSTVYLRYHYVIDLIAGAVIALGRLAIGLRLHAGWDRLYEARAGLLT
jgi:membrane-associated phospholipid phosphatase